MMDESRLHGVYVPVITPFLAGGELDAPSFQHHIGVLLDAGVHGIVIAGTTGESPTLAWEEIARLVEAAREARAVRGSDTPIVVGTGTNDTAATVRRSHAAGKLGADAVLVVTPYYSRPSQEGILEHYRAAAQAGIPVIAYEVPARTGIRTTVDTMKRILDLDGVIGLKDASGSLQLLDALTAARTKPVLCGEDIFFHASLSQGAAGGMLASANVETAAFLDVYRQFRAGRLPEADIAFNRLAPLIRLLFEESNPSPLKQLLFRQGLLASGKLRLPMMPVSAELRTKLEPFV